MVVRLILGVGCVIMGVLSLSGMFVRGGTTERLMVGFGWILIGVGWLIRCYLEKKRSGSGHGRGPEDDGER